MAKNFREFFKYKLPEPFWSDQWPWLQRLTHVTLLPYDIYLQILEYLPRLRDLKNGTVPDDALRLIGAERKIEKFSKESSNEYALKLSKAWDIWKYSGSRYGLNLLYHLSGIELDSTNFSYGIEENMEEFYPNYWGEEYLYWGHFNWGDDLTDGYAEAWSTYSIYIKDPTTALSTNSTTIKQIEDTAKRFAPAHCRLCFVYFTNGSGTVHTTLDVRGE